MKSCNYPRTLLRPAEHLLVLLLIELTLYVRPCAMEMPTLLAALLHDTRVQHHTTFEEFNDELIPPPPAPQRLQSVIQPVAITADSAAAAEAATSVNSMNELIERNEMFNDADAAIGGGGAVAPVTDKHKHDDFEIAIPPPMATAGIPITEIVHRHVASPHEIVASRYCSIEITSKVPGICQTIPHHIGGSACVAGDYMDVFNVECMNGM